MPVAFIFYSEHFSALTFLFYNIIVHTCTYSIAWHWIKYFSMDIIGQHSRIDLIPSQDGKCINVSVGVSYKYKLSTCHTLVCHNGTTVILLMCCWFLNSATLTLRKARTCHFTPSEMHPCPPIYKPTHFARRFPFRTRCRETGLRATRRWDVFLRLPWRCVCVVAQLSSSVAGSFRRSTEL